MKHNKSIFAIAIISALTFFYTPAKANDDKTIVPVEMKLVGNIKNQPLVELKFNTSKQDNQFVISITDQYDNILYSGNATGENFTKRILLDTNDLGDAILTFEITSKKTGKSITYKVTRELNTVEQTNVVKL